MLTSPALPTPREALPMPFHTHRLGVIMEPQSDDPWEAGGVFNPGVARAPDGSLHLFPRLVGRNGLSRIGIARVLFDEAGEPRGVRREITALEPQTDYDAGGCEDARVTFVEPLGQYVMTYTALTLGGPRIALAASSDMFHWRRLGLAWFQPQAALNFNHVPNKDGSIFPAAVPNPHGDLALAMIHRPLYAPPESAEPALPMRLVDIPHESIWISYSPPIEAVMTNPNLLCHFESHHRLASPVSAWERLKIGGGAPPVRTQYGFVVVYHGVSDAVIADGTHPTYSAGVLVLDEHDPRMIVYRSPEPVLVPETPEELAGRVPRVVFPTGIDRRDDIRQPNRVDVYYGMADFRVGAARIDLVGPELPPGALPDPHRGRV